jgi:hypothetical protein
MHWLKPLALLVALAVVVQANCAVSCLHSHSGKVSLPDTSAQPPADCHHTKTPDKSDENESGNECSHSRVSGDRASISAKFVQPLPTALVAEVMPSFSSETARFIVAELPDFLPYGSAPPITILRI